ncbi:hypothetical protein ACWEQL_00535 [Kitasatospora sp. NPDC004240]
MNEQFRTTVARLPLAQSYPAEIAAGCDSQGAVRPRFSRDVVERIAADLRSLGDAAPTSFA